MSVLTFLGDVWLPYQVESEIDVSDKYIFNLEGPITRSEIPAPGKINIKVDREFYKETFGKYPIAVCLANNHIMDYGEQGFLDTIEVLNKKNIRFFGAGSLKDNCNNPLFLNIDEKKIAFMGYVCHSTHPLFADEKSLGVMPIMLEKIVQDIQFAKNNKADRIVIQLHWGDEEVYLPKPEDVIMAHAIVDAGADLIIGHHAHCIQPHEMYKGKYIFYGLGNCIFPNFDLMVNYGQEKNSPYRWVQKWGRWNELSFKVSVDIGLNEVNFCGVAYDQKKCREIKLSSKYQLHYSLKYDQLYRRNYKYSQLRNVIGRFFIRPKIPSAGAFLNIIKSFFKK